MEKFNFLIGSYLGTIKAMFSIRLWTPFLIFAIISVIVLWLFANPFLPVIGPAVSQVAKLIAGSGDFAQYPHLFVYLPRIYGWAIIVLSVLLEVLLIGAGFVMLSGYYRRERVGFLAALSTAKTRYFQLVAVWLFYTVVFVALLLFLPKLFNPYIGGSPRRTLAFNIGLRFLGSIILAVFMYVLPNILIEGERFFAAVRTSIRTFAGSVVSSYVIALVPYLMVLPFTIVLFRPRIIVDRFNPELVFYLILGEIVVNMIAGFVFASTVLRFHREYSR